MPRFFSFEASWHCKGALSRLRSDLRWYLEGRWVEVRVLGGGQGNNPVTGGRKASQVERRVTEFKQRQEVLFLNKLSVYNTIPSFFVICVFSMSLNNCWVGKKEVWVLEPILPLTSQGPGCLRSGLGYQVSSGVAALALECPSFSWFVTDPLVGRQHPRGSHPVPDVFPGIAITKHFSPPTLANGPRGLSNTHGWESLKITWYFHPL